LEATHKPKLLPNEKEKKKNVGWLANAVLLTARFMTLTPLYKRKGRARKTPMNVEVSVTEISLSSVV